MTIRSRPSNLAWTSMRRKVWGLSHKHLIGSHPGERERDARILTVPQSDGIQPNNGDQRRHAE